MNKITYEHAEVNSLAIRSLKYFTNKKLLMVKFNNDDNYGYKNVSWDTYISFKYADSIGKFFNSKIRNNYELA